MLLRNQNQDEGVINMGSYNFGAREDVSARSDRNHSDEPTYDLSSIQVTLCIIVFGILFLVYLVVNS